MDGKLAQRVEVGGRGQEKKGFKKELRNHQWCRGSCSRGLQEKWLQGLKKLEQRWARKEVARVEEVGTEVGKKRGCKG